MDSIINTNQTVSQLSIIEIPIPGKGIYIETEPRSHKYRSLNWVITVPAHDEAPTGARLSADPMLTKIPRMFFFLILAPFCPGEDELS